MATQGLNNFKVELGQPFMLRDILPGAAYAPYHVQLRQPAWDTDEGSDATAGEQRCLKGFFVAVALEAVIAVSVVGFWQLWHLVR